MNIADLFVFHVKPYQLDLKKYKTPLFFPTIDYFPSDNTYTTDTIKVPQNGRKPPLSQFYDILPSFSLANIIGFISHEEKKNKWKKKPSITCKRYTSSTP